MRKQKISVVLSPHILEEISHLVAEGERSRFIEQAVEKELERVKRAELVEAYRESAKEAAQENSFFEGASGDGLSETTVGHEVKKSVRRQLEIFL